MSKTILITGCSSGFGRLIAKKFQETGWNVIATMRSPEKEKELNTLANVMLSKLDVTDTTSIETTIKEGVARFGSIDVLVNNAGFGTMGPFESTSDELAKNIFDVNVLGLIKTTKAVLPQMRAQKAGLIINVSSLVGLVSFPYQALYHATKFAVQGFTEALRYELNPLGIQLKLINPGGYHTSFLDTIAKSDAQGISDYQAGFTEYNTALSGLLDTLGDPQEVADIVYTAVTDGTDQIQYLCGDFAHQLVGARSNMDVMAFQEMMKNQLKLS